MIWFSKIAIIILLYLYSRSNIVNRRNIINEMYHKWLISMTSTDWFEGFETNWMYVASNQQIVVQICNRT